MNEQQLKDKLYGYKITLERRNTLDIRIADSWRDFGPQGLSYDKEKLSPSHKFSSATENEAYRHMEEYEELIKEHGKLDSEVKQIDAALRALDDREQKVIRMFYIERKNWVDVAHEIDRTYEHTKRFLHKEAINKMMKVLR